MANISMNNQATIQGRLGSDPVLRHTSNHKPVCNLSVAISNDYKDKETGEWIEREPTWVNITVWGKLAERAVETTGKGLLVRVSGRLASRKRTVNLDVTGGKQSKAVEHQITELYIEAAEIGFLEKREEVQPANHQVARVPSAQAVEPDF
jgi:single stranded DNA-binding protein